MAKDAAELGDAITQRMNELDMSQQELSRRSGVSVSTLRRLQRGIAQRRNPATLAAISTALDWPDSYLRDLWSRGPIEVGSHQGGDTGQVAILRTEVADLRSRVERIENAQRGAVQ